jgi:hypothetical protein
VVPLFHGLGSTNFDLHIFAKQLSLALIKQKEGGSPQLTESGVERVKNPSELARSPN